MIPLQIISVIFGLLMLYVIYIHKKKNHLSPLEFTFWICLWLAFIYAAILPQTFKGVIESLHIARVFDLLVIVALMIIVYITFKNRMDLKNLEEKIEEIVRKRTIDK